MTKAQHGLGSSSRARISGRFANGTFLFWGGLSQSAQVGAAEGNPPGFQQNQERLQFLPFAKASHFPVKLEEKKQNKTLWAEGHHPGRFRNAEPELSISCHALKKTQETIFSKPCCHHFVPAGTHPAPGGELLRSLTIVTPF